MINSDKLVKYSENKCPMAQLLDKVIWILLEILAENI